MCLGENTRANEDAEDLEGYPNDSGDEIFLIDVEGGGEKEN